jgi:hypothetical protein
LDEDDATVKAASKGCTACPANSVTKYESYAVGGALGDCKVAPGYYLKTADATDVTKVVISQATANHFSVGGTSVTANTPDAVGAYDDSVAYRECPDRTHSSVGSSELADCYLDGGYYLSYPPLQGYARSRKNYYTPGGSSVSSEEADETPKECPYAGTSAVGSDAIADCTPKCGTGTAVASSGTCVCKAGYTGTPTPEGSTPTGGCSAQLCKANEFVKSNACTACPSGKTNVAGDDASGIDTECDSPASPAASADADVAAAVSAAHDLAPGASRMVVISLVSAVALFL